MQLKYIINDEGDAVPADEHPWEFPPRRGMSRSHWRHCDKEFKRRAIAALHAWSRSWDEHRFVARDLITLKTVSEPSESLPPLASYALVSTVFLAMDHSFAFPFGGPPVLWETMIFDCPGLDDYQQRYTSKADALVGHEAAVSEAIKAARTDDHEPRRITKAKGEQVEPYRRAPRTGEVEPNA